MSLFDCYDYREILRTELSRRMKQNPRYSQGAFARDLHLTPARLSEILRGKQGVSPTVAVQIADYLRLKDEERGFFLDLVESLHGRSVLARESARLRLNRFRKTSYAESHGDQAFHDISDWYYVAILELLRLPRSRPEAAWIAEALGLDAELVANALEQLIQLGFLKLSASGATVCSDVHQRFIGSVHSESFQKFSRQILWKAIESVDETRAHAMHSYMLALPAGRLPRLLALIKDSSNALAEALDTDQGEKDVVYCLSVQFFPISEEPAKTLSDPLH